MGPDGRSEVDFVGAERRGGPGAVGDAGTCEGMVSEESAELNRWLTRARCLEKLVCLHILFWSCGGAPRCGRGITSRYQFVSAYDAIRHKAHDKRI